MLEVVDGNLLITSKNLEMSNHKSLQNSQSFSDNLTGSLQCKFMDWFLHDTDIRHERIIFYILKI